MSVTLGIDIGTSGTKTIAVDQSGAILATASAEYPCSYPHPGWSEQDPDQWWAATIATVRDVMARARLKPADVQGVGLSGQMHGSVFVDGNGRVIRPAILWNDQRTGKQCAEIESRAGGREALIHLVANPALTGFTAPKVLWLREIEPENFEKVHKVLLPKDYIRHRLTGQFATEVSDASGTLLFDVRERRWSTELLGKLDLDAELLPECYESTEVSATVGAAGSEATGLLRGTPVVGGGGDQPAGAVGNGIVRPGVVSATMGTSGVVFAHTHEVGFDPHGRLQRFCHSVPGAYCAFGVVLSAGGSMRWVRDELGELEIEAAKAEGVDPYVLLTAQAELARPGSEGLFFLPYLTGERTPHFDPEARGGWIGLTVRHGRQELIRSVMEGATYAMRDCLELVREMGVDINQIRLSGGGARCGLWRQIQADIYGQDVCTINASEGPAFGAALLAMVGIGAFSSVPEACDATIQVAETTHADARATLLYNRGFHIYRKLYQDLKGTFPEMSKFLDHPELLA